MAASPALTSSKERATQAGPACGIQPYSGFRVMGFYMAFLRRADLQFRKQSSVNC